MIIIQIIGGNKNKIHWAVKISSGQLKTLTVALLWVTPFGINTHPKILCGIRYEQRGGRTSSCKAKTIKQIRNKPKLPFFGAEIARSDQKGGGCSSSGSVVLDYLWSVPPWYPHMSCRHGGLRIHYYLLNCVCLLAPVFDRGKCGIWAF